MEAQSRGYEIYERRGGLQFNAGEVAVSGQISQSEVAADAVPIVCSLQGEFGIFGGF